jgi:hypothetical protein
MAIKYKVNWDNGYHACGTFSNVFDTEEAAQDFANHWAAEMNVLNDNDPGSEDGYTAEVIEVESAPEYDEEEGLGPEFWC